MSRNMPTTGRDENISPLKDNDDIEIDVGGAGTSWDDGPSLYLMRSLSGMDQEENLLSAEDKNTTSTPASAYPLVDKARRKDLAKSFSSAAQLRKLLWDGFLLWARTAILLGFTVFTLWNNGKRRVMSHAERQMFNTFITGLNLALGLNIATGLNTMAMNLRWYYLARRKRSLAEVDTLLKSDVSSLSFYCLHPRPWATLLTISWLLINIGSQIGVATIGLTYSMDAVNDAALFVQNGEIMVANLTTYFPSNSVPAPLLEAAEYTANIYGNLAIFDNVSDDISNAPNLYDTYASFPQSYWIGDTYCMYRYLNSPPDTITGQSPYALYSDRTINTTWSCNAFPVTLPSGNGYFNTIDVYSLEGDGTTTEVWIPSVQPEETTYFQSTGCGPRCRQIVVFEASTISPWYYTCNISVTQVYNAILPEHQVNDFVASTSAASIALGGSSSNETNSTESLKYQRYPRQSLFGVAHQGDTDKMGSTIAQFAIGSLSIMDKKNPKILSSGVQPQPGFRLTISELPLLYVIFSLIGCLQLLLFLVTTFMANRVIVTDDSPIAIARLLQPIVNRLGTAGTVATGREICKALEKEDNMKVIYSVHRNDNKGMSDRLILGDEVRERAFPNGVYE